MSWKHCKLAIIGNVLILLFVIARAEQSSREQKAERIQYKQQVQAIVLERRANTKFIHPRGRNLINGSHFGRSSDFVHVRRSRRGSNVNEEKSAQNFKMLHALSKIANVRLADETVRNPRVVSPGIGSIFGKRISIGKDHEDHKVQKSNSIEQSKMEFEPKKFHCHPIGDTYIPTVNMSMPAYICKLNKIAFVLSSERFLQDHRDQLDVNVDASTYYRLVQNPMALNGSELDVISATLVLKSGKDSYGIRKSRRILKDEEMSDYQ